MIASNASPGRVLRLALKELRETLRDRRTVVTLILMPVLIYPLLGIALRRLVVLESLQRTRIEYVVAVENESAADTFLKVFRRGDELTFADANLPYPAERVAEGTYDDPAVRLITPPESNAAVDAVALLKERFADVALRISGPPPAQPRAEASRTGIDAADAVDAQAPLNVAPNATALPQFEILFDAASPISRDARTLIADRLDRARRELIEQALSRAGGDAALAQPVREIAVATVVATGAVSLSALVPLVLILMTVTGAVYPAIDLTAGERERGTLEALIATPVPRESLLLGKYIAVLTVAMMTALANLAAMTITMYSLGLEQLLFGKAGLGPGAILMVLGLLVTFAGFFSALILVITSLARSFKEAQAYLIPLMMVSLAPGILSLMPGLRLTLPLAVTPLANLVLLSRDALEGQVHLGLGLIAFLTTCAYARLALALAARIFGTDALLYGSEGTWRDLVQRPDNPLGAPSPSSAWFALAIVLPAFITLAGLIPRFENYSMEARLGINSLILITLFGGVPLLLCWWQRCTPGAGLGMLAARGTSYVAAVCLGVAVWPWAFELERLVLPDSRLAELEPLLKTLQADLDRVPLWWKLVTLALTPAICEELFFRGFLISSWRQRSPWVIVLLSGGLFGAFHVLVRDTLFLERFVPTAALGCLLAMIYLRSGSLWPGVLLHAVHNSLLLTLSDQVETLKQAGIGTVAETHLPISWLVTSLVPIAIGVLLLLPARRDPTAATAL